MDRSLDYLLVTITDSLFVTIFRIREKVDGGGGGLLEQSGNCRIVCYGVRAGTDT
jgi:hypothetical protein